MDKRFSVMLWLEIVDYLLDLIDEATSLLVGIANLTEALPERYNNDLRVWPDLVDAADQLDVAVVVLFACYVVCGCSVFD